MFKSDFPLSFSSKEKAQESFQELKSDFSHLLKKGEWFSRSEFDDKFKIDQYIDICNVGNQSSHYYHAATRYACDSLNSPSVIRSWFEPKIRKSVENCKFFDENPATALILRKYLPSQFRPSAAKCLMDIVNPSTFYDPCGGWGDRLSSAMAKEIPDIYLRDVNPLVFCGYVQQVNDMCSINSLVNMEMVGCEEQLNIKNLDMIFTSPPYFSVEKYQGELQSFRKYKKFDQWLHDFLFKMIEINLNAISSNGIFILNVSDVYANHTYNRIVEPILKTFESHITGVYGYRMRKRLNSKSNQAGIFAEPVIVFNKNLCNI